MSGRPPGGASGTVVVSDKKGQGHLTAACLVLMPRSDAFETVFLYQKLGFFISEIQFFFFSCGKFVIWKMKRLRPSEVDAWLNRAVRMAGLGFEPGALGFSGRFPLHISSRHAC